MKAGRIVLLAFAGLAVCGTCDAEALRRPFIFREESIVVSVTSAAPCKIMLEGRLCGWMPGGREPVCFRLDGGKGWRVSRLVTEATPHGVGLRVLEGAEAERAKLSDVVLGSAKFRCTKGKRWLYRLGDGETIDFRADGTYRGFPSASLRCVRTGKVRACWGGRTMEIRAEASETALFEPVALADADSISFTVEGGEFEVNDVAFTTVAGPETAGMEFASSDGRLDASFRKAKRVCDRTTMAGIVRNGLGLKDVDERRKTVTLDPMVRNGLVFCGAKLPVADGVLDIRWMRDTPEEMATVTETLPEDWKLVRDFDMQAACQRICDAAVADGLQGGVQFCAYRRGRRIVDVCAGRLSTNANAATVRSDSLFPIFSTEKPLLATACHRAVERGLMDYDKPLCTWWPELTGDGKEKLTLRETLAYRTRLPGGAPGGAGNPVCGHEMTDRELCDWDLVCRTAAADRPNGIPGTKQKYLPYAYAWMIGHPLEVAMKKPLKQVLDEEVLIPSGIERDFFFVVPRREYSRVATFYYGQFCENMNEDWARQAILPSAWAVSSADALCRFYNRLCGYDGKAPLIRKETLEAALRPCRHPTDPLPSAKSLKRDWHMIFGMGYGLWGSVERMDRVFGHGGAGGSEALVDRDNELVIAFTCNFCKSSSALRDRLYEVVGMRWRYWNDNVNIQDLQMSTSSGGSFGAGITSR